MLRGKLEKIPVLSNLYLLVVVVLGWVVFRFTDMELGLTVVKGMFGLNGNALTAFNAVTLLKNNMFLLLVCAFACLPVMKWLRQELEDAVAGSAFLRTVWNLVFYSLIPAVLLLLSTASLVGDSYNPFIYFQF